MKAFFIGILVTMALLAITAAIDPSLGTYVALALMQPLVFALKAGFWLHG